MAYLGEHQIYNLRAWVQNSLQSFGQWLKVLANLTDLTNLFSRNLGKTPMTVIAIEITLNVVF